MPLHVITGMHRSGTSALAGALAAAGLDLGDEADHLPPAPDNPKGFFEHQDFKTFNDHVFEVAGATWDSVPTLVGEWWRRREYAALRARASTLIDDWCREERDFTVKDPRAVFTLPLWRSVTTVSGVVISMRSPEEVVASLGRRNRMEPSRAAELWIRYVTMGVRTAPDAHLLFLDDLFAEPRSRLAEVVRTFGLSPDDFDLAAGVAFLDRGLTTSSPTVPGSEELDAARWLYEAMRHRRGETQQIVRRLEGRATNASQDPLEARRRLEDERERRERHQNRAQKVQAEAERLHAQLEDERERRERHQNRAQKLQTEVERLRVQVAAVRSQLVEVRDRAGALQKDHAERGRDLKRLRGTLASERRTLQQRAERAEYRYERLRSRRAVRFSLRAARFMRPLFRLIRRVRGGGLRSRLSRGMPAVPPAAPDDVGPRDAAGGTGGEAPRPVPEALPLVVDKHLSNRGDHAVELGTVRAAVERAADAQVTVLVPVHDAPEALERCLDSIRRNTCGHAQLLIIDDASRLDETRALLERYERLDGVTVLRNQDNLGFTRTVNRGLGHVAGDVVVLNSDTEVGPRWLASLRLAAYSSDRTGTATAVSDNAGAFTIPVPGRYCPAPPHLDTDGVARVAAVGPWVLPETPTANGFCAYFRRDMLDAVGLFDAEAFPRGYGEENDLSLRAASMGWRHVVADGVFVRHVRSASFGEEKHELMAAGRRRIDERHPDYTRRVRTFMSGEPMRIVRDRAAERWDTAGPEAGRPRVLYVVHAGGGGTPKTAVDLAVGISDSWDSFVMTCDSRRLTLHVVRDGVLSPLDTHLFDPPLRFGETGREDVLDLYSTLLVELAIDVLHVRHLVKNSLDLLTAAADLGVPTVLSLHDFFMVCPTIHLMDEESQFCAGACTAGPGPCAVPMSWVADQAPPLKHDGVYWWRELVGPLLQRADAIVTTSATVKDVHLRSFPDLHPDDITLIEHGRDLDWSPIDVAPPESGGVVRLLLPGNLAVHKGTDYVREMLRHDTEGRLDVHLLGRVAAGNEDLGTYHGTYTREDFAERVSAIAPHFIGILSTTAESYSHTLSESLMTGVPIAGTDIGAVGERLRAHGGGVLLPVDDPEAGLTSLLSAADDHIAWSGLRLREKSGVRTVLEMSQDYERLYRSVLARRRCIEFPGPARLRVSVVTPGLGLGAPASSHVRLLRPLGHPSLATDLDVRQVPPEALAEVTDADVVVVHRTALEHVDHGAVLATLGDRGIPIVVDVDDLLFDPDRLPQSSDREWAPAVEALRASMQAAVFVTVSTDPLLDAARELVGDVRLVRNAVDERLWFAPTPDGSSPGRGGTEHPSSEAGAPLRVLYMGSRTHGADLELVRPAIERLRERDPDGIRIGVVGGETTPSEWYDSIPIPFSVYDRFVPWLRTVATEYDVAVAPLVDDEFNASKSDLKWLEYSAMGLPVIVSDVPSYRSVKDGITGLVVGSGPDEWVTALRSMRHGDLRDELRAAARLEVLAERTLARTANRWVALLREAAASTTSAIEMSASDSPDRVSGEA